VDKVGTVEMLMVETVETVTLAAVMAAREELAAMAVMAESTSDPMVKIL
jgi:hypothetical protein